MRRFGIFALFLSLCLVLCTCTAKPLSEQKSVEAPDAATEAIPEQGRIIVLIVDISQSIKGQLDAIIDGLCNEIVDKRIQPKDYCVVVPLGDAANVENADYFSVRFNSDKEKIRSYLNSIRTWMPSNLNTDIGAAMHKAWYHINRIEAEKQDDMCEPLVLLITDGEIYESPSSKDPVLYKSPEEIFQDSDMNPSLNSYQNWWFLGIENEGVPLEHIKSIAQRVGAYPDRYKKLDNMNVFGQLFDEWLSSIPDPVPRDDGKIFFSNFKIGEKLLSQDAGNYTLVSTGEDSVAWTVRSSYSRTSTVLKFNSIEAVFQNEASGQSCTFSLIPEAGNLELAPGSFRLTGAKVNFPHVSGKGRLKLDIKTDVQAASSSVAQEIPEYQFSVELKSPLRLLLEKIAVPALILLLLILVFVIVRIAKARAAVKIKLSVVGKSDKKTHAVSMKIHKKAEFGSRPGVPFKLDGVGYAPVIGTFERTGSKSYKVTPRDGASFATGQEKVLEDYKLGTGIKLVLRDKSTVTIKFRK